MTHHDYPLPTGDNGAPSDVIAAFRRLVESGERDTAIGVLTIAGLSQATAESWYDEARRRYLAHLHATTFTDTPPTPPVQPIWGPR